MGIRRPTERLAILRLERGKQKERPEALGGATPVIPKKNTLPNERKSD